MVNQQRQGELCSFPSRVAVCCVLLIGLLLTLLLPAAGWSCDNGPTTMPRKYPEWVYDGNSFSRKFIPRLKTNDDNKNQQNIVRISTQRPASLSSEDIAKLLTVSSRKYVSNLDFETASITKWETPLRVRILDATGEDLPDDHYQRKSIAAYLDNLSQDIQFPISITTQDKYDNNVSLIIGMLPRNYNSEMRVSDARNAHLELTAPPFVVNDEFGAILGVSSMDDAQKKLANIWLGNKGTRGEWHGKIEFSNIYDVYPLQKHLATYSVDAEIQSCVMIFGREQIEANDVNITMATLEEWMPKCLGLDVQKLRDYYTDHPKRSKLSATLQNNERYFLKLLYNYTKAGMPIPAAISVIKNQVSQH